MILSPSEYDDTCPITYEPYVDLAKQQNLVVTSCGHKFSKVAIAEWSGRHASCPSCRRHIDKKDFKDVTLAASRVANSRLNNHVDPNDERKALEESALQLALQESLKYMPKPEQPNPSRPFTIHHITRLDNIQPRAASTHASFREIERPSLVYEIQYKILQLRTAMLISRMWREFNEMMWGKNRRQHLPFIHRFYPAAVFV
jgi:hypothetical protein